MTSLCLSVSVCLSVSLCISVSLSVSRSVIGDNGGATEPSCGIGGMKGGGWAEGGHDPVTLRRRRLERRRSDDGGNH